MPKISVINQFNDWLQMVDFFWTMPSTVDSDMYRDTQILPGMPRSRHLGSTWNLHDGVFCESKLEYLTIEESIRFFGEGPTRRFIKDERRPVTTRDITKKTMEYCGKMCDKVLLFPSVFGNRQPAYDMRTFKFRKYKGRSLYEYVRAWTYNNVMFYTREDHMRFTHDWTSSWQNGTRDDLLIAGMWFDQQTKYFAANMNQRKKSDELIKQLEEMRTSNTVTLREAPVNP